VERDNELLAETGIPGCVFVHTRASIIRGCKQVECKLTVSLTQEPRNSVREISGPCINNKDVTTIWTGAEPGIEYRGPCI
jgi:hypothetical protein